MLSELVNAECWGALNSCEVTVRFAFPGFYLSCRNTVIWGYTNQGVKNKENFDQNAQI